MAITITNILTIGGSTTFSGTDGGFTTKDYIQTVAGSTVTLKSGVTYTVQGQLTITGTVTQRCTLRGESTPLISATGTVSGTTLNITSGNITVPSPPTGFNYIMSQSEANFGLLRRPVVAMNDTDAALITSFPVVTPAGPTSTFTLSKGFTMGSRGLRIGLSAKFIHTQPQTSRNINYVNTFDIDSRTSNGIIQADNSYQNRIGIPNPNLWRTVNWDSLNPLTPLITIAYVE
jgi:hypothetical protein